MVYKWKQERFKANAQKVGEELERIPNKHASNVVNTARKAKGGELHKCFEWDDAIAGEEHRKEQARLILRMIVIDASYKTPEGVETVEIRAFESVRFEKTEGEAEKAMTYIPTRKALADPELRVQIMDGLETTIVECERTAEAYTYLVPQFKKTKEKLTEARKTLRS